MAARKKPSAEASLLDRMSEVAGAEVVADDNALARVARLAKELREADLATARAEDALKAAKADARRIAETDLPEAMREAGVKTFETTEGLIVSTSEEVTVGIPAPLRGEANDWLIEHGYGGLIKSELEMSFDRDHLDDAQALVDQLREEGYEVGVSQTIHPQTLKAFVKERLKDTESEEEFPLELFGVRPYTLAKVKARK